MLVRSCGALNQLLSSESKTDAELIGDFSLNAANVVCHEDDQLLFIYIYNIYIYIYDFFIHLFIYSYVIFIYKYIYTYIYMCVCANPLLPSCPHPPISREVEGIFGGVWVCVL